MSDMSPSEGVQPTDPSPADERAPDAALPSLKPVRYEPPSVVAAQQRHSHWLLLMVVRLLFLVMLVSVTILTVSAEADSKQFDVSTVVGLLMATGAIGVIVLVLDVMTPNKRLSTVIGTYLGVCVGLIGAVAIGSLLDGIVSALDIGQERSGVYLALAKVVIGIILCYLCVSVVLTTKDDFRLIIPYVEFSKQVRGVRPLLLDTSTLIDGRINDLGQTGFLDAPIILPQFVIDELQTLADSTDKLKRTRGRRGLDMVSKLQANPFLDVTIDNPEVEGLSVDRMLIELARSQQLRILTTDHNLKKVAQIHGVAVLNVNDLANSLKASVVPGDPLQVQIVKLGENPSQGVGYLPDGTMVVVEDAAERLGETVDLIVTNSLQTSAGRMIFARIDGVAPSAEADRAVAHLGRSATAQPRITRPPARSEPPPSGRNPRRG
jgi:uncharacterized protein YacL